MVSEFWLYFLLYFQSYICYLCTVTILSSSSIISWLLDQWRHLQLIYGGILKLPNARIEYLWVFSLNISRDDWKGLLLLTFHSTIDSLIWVHAHVFGSYYLYWLVPSPEIYGRVSQVLKCPTVPQPRGRRRHFRWHVMTSHYVPA